MTRKQLKKYIKFSLFLILIIIIIVVIRLIMLNLHSREKMLKRLISGIDNLNYNYTTDDENKIQVVGKYEKIITTDKEIYNDYENKVTREILNDSSFMDEYTNNGIYDTQYYDEFIKYYLDTDEYYKYKYKGKKELDGKKYTVIEFYTTGEFSRDEVYYWIDDTTNLIYKVENYQYNIETDKMEKKSEKEYEFDIGSNKIEDVKISDEVLSTHSSNTNG